MLLRTLITHIKSRQWPQIRLLLRWSYNRRYWLRCDIARVESENIANQIVKTAAAAVRLGLRKGHQANHHDKETDHDFKHRAQ